ncbi:hypothetical protein V8D89_007112 [Ganoderma adspersum]
MLAPLIFALPLLASRVLVAHAQGTEVACLPEYAWMTNSLGQNPCLVTSWLWTPCSGLGNASTVLKLPAGWVYGGPDSKDPFQSTPCKCNTVVYSVLAACGICQIGNSNVKAIDAWPTYSSNCTTVYNGTYPEPIPDETAVPKWAFLDVISNSNFDVNAANSVAVQGLPDVTTETSSIPSSTTPSSRSPASSTPASDKTGTQSPTGSQTSPPTQQSGRNVGAIVGGVIGALVGLLLVGALVLYIILRHRRQASRDSQSLDTGGSRSAGVRELSGLQTPIYHVPTLKGKAESMRGLYDPDDPRTYPTPRRAAMGYSGLPQVMS